MREPDPYPTAAGVEAAIKEAARRAAAASPSLQIAERIRLEYFNRFLSRVFSDVGGSTWLLKGGTAMLARVPSTRSTVDIDLHHAGFTLVQALADLRRLAETGLGDHFRFIYTGHTEAVGGEEQPYTDGYRVSFDVYIGASRKGSLRVDLVEGAGVTAPVTTARPASSLDLPRLVSHEFRLYPVVDQLADKVCATMTTYGGRASSREKDLVDIVVLAVTQDIDGSTLGKAIRVEARRRRMAPFTAFTVPTSWGRGYSQLARSVPYCVEHRTVPLANELAENLINPAIRGLVENKVWSHVARAWTWDASSGPS